MVGNTHPIIIPAMAHYNMVRIHPFDDGDGRGARILMNLILMKAGFPPDVIRNEEREDYLNALRYCRSRQSQSIYHVRCCIFMGYPGAQMLNLMTVTPYSIIYQRGEPDQT